MDFGSGKTIDEMIEEQEELDEEIKIAQRKKLLRKAKEKGVDPALYSRDGTKQGIDWNQMKMRL